jgi:hypothetical protein
LRTRELLIFYTDQSELKACVHLNLKKWQLGFSFDVKFVGTDAHFITVLGVHSKI